jgi:hypothetical protein
MMRRSFVLLVVTLLSAGTAVTSAQTSPAPTPTPTATPGFSLQVMGSNVVVDQAASGPGLTPPEAGAFEAGLPISPMSPYDWFTSAAETPGVAGQFQYLVTASERTRSLTATAVFAFDAYDGDVNNLMYWGEPLVGPFDPHEGHSPLNYAINFPTHAGQNTVTALQGVFPYAMSVGGNDGSWKLSGGYVNLAQTDRFVFAPPAVTNANPSVGVQTAETLGPGMPSLDSWTASPSTLPVLGADAILNRGSVTLELTDALLPVLSGTQARFGMASLVDDLGDAGRFSAEVVDINTSGQPISTTTYYGTNQMLYPSAQGRLYSSILDDQHQIIGGLRALFHPWHGYDALVELGRAWYSVQTPEEPGTNAPGDYQHFSFIRHFNPQTDAGVEYYRFDPRYATVILPYGVPENIWSVAWSWPGNWLKSTYQAVDNTTIGINREGYRAHVDYTHGRLELHADTYAWREVEPITLASASQEGWVDGFFLPEAQSDATLGWQRQAGLYAAWHLAKDDLALDFVWDRSYRPAGADPVDLVDTNYPQVVASWQHHWSKRALGAIGFGRYSANGTWSTTPVLGIYDSAFAGAQWDFGNGQQLLLSVRRYGLTGLPSIPGGPPPTMRGTALVVDHRITF